MGCYELRHLLNTQGQEQDISTDLVAAHIYTCPNCSQGIVRLAQALLKEDTLSCDVCRTRIPDYYEATHPDHPLVKMDDADLLEVALHLKQCASCQEEYRAFVLLCELEEHDEMVD